MIKKDKYDEINKHYFMEVKYVSWLDWHRLNKMHGYNVYHDDFFVRVNPLLSFFYLMTLLSSLALSIIVWWSSLIAFLLICLIFYEVVYKGIICKPDRDWINLNRSHYLQLEGEDKNKYYSKWYLEAIQYSGYICSFEQVERPNNRKHWKNNIPENRVLSWKEYKKYKKNKSEQQRLLAEAEYIQEFKEYYDLEVKQIDEFVK